MLIQTQNLITQIKSFLRKNKTQNNIKLTTEQLRLESNFVSDEIRRRQDIYNKAVPLRHPISCGNCIYYTSLHGLKCAVNPLYPSLVDSFKETDCKDFEKKR
jgi:hypothetical protein